MSVIIAVLCRDLKGKQEIFVASEGRSIESGTKNIRTEDYIKTKKISARTCIGYTGDYGEFYEAVFLELKISLAKINNPEISVVANKLRRIILSLLQMEPHVSVEKIYGPLVHKFLLAGLDRNKMKVATLASGDNFLIQPFVLESKQNIYIHACGATDEVQKRCAQLICDRLKHPKPLDQIPIDLHQAIKTAAKTSFIINDHTYIRRLSNSFKLETDSSEANK